MGSLQSQRAIEDPKLQTTVDTVLCCNRREVTRKTCILSSQGLPIKRTSLPHLVVCIRRIHGDGQRPQGFDIVDELCPLVLNVLDDGDGSADEDAARECGAPLHARLIVASIREVL